MSTFRVNEIAINTELKIIAIESVGLQHYKINNSTQLYGKIEPIAIIVASTDGIYALNMAAESVDLDKLKHDIPELDAML